MMTKQEKLDFLNKIEANIKHREKRGAFPYICWAILDLTSVSGLASIEEYIIDNFPELMKEIKDTIRYNCRDSTIANRTDYKSRYLLLNRVRKIVKLLPDD